MNRLFIILFAVFSMFQVLFSNAALAHDELTSGSPVQAGEIGINERVGQSVPLDTVFYDEQGNKKTLKQLFDKPVVLSLVYYGCDRECPLLLAAVAEVTGRLKLTPGKDYTLISLSFDPDDTPYSARKAKSNYVKLMGSSFHEDAWTFLTGTNENIKSVLDAVGYTVKKDEIHGFSHPVALVVLSPAGRIVRYVYSLEDNGFTARQSVDFQPFDLSLAISDAGKGKTGFSIKRVIAYCFPHQPKGQELFFNTLKICGAVISLLLISFLFFLLRKPRGESKK
jgi:protein SCO1/2